jgi:hypothetical protein
LGYSFHGDGLLVDGFINFNLIRFPSPFLSFQVGGGGDETASSIMPKVAKSKTAAYEQAPIVNSKKICHYEDNEGI